MVKEYKKFQNSILHHSDALARPINGCFTLSQVVHKMRQEWYAHYNQTKKGAKLSLNKHHIDSIRSNLREKASDKLLSDQEMLMASI